MSYRPSSVHPEEFERLAAQARIRHAQEYSALEAVGLPSRGLGLDVGCGAGEFAAALKSEERLIEGIDADPVAVRRAETVIPAWFATAENTDIKSCFYDFSYSRLVLRHVADPKAVLEEQVRLVRPDGWLGAIDTADSSLLLSPEPKFFNLARFARKEWFRDRGGDPDIGLKLYGALKTAGLDDVRVTTVVYDSATLGREAFASVVLETWLQAMPSTNNWAATARAGVEEWVRNPQAFGCITMFVAGGLVP